MYIDTSFIDEPPLVPVLSKASRLCRRIILSLSMVVLTSFAIDIVTGCWVYDFGKQHYYGAITEIKYQTRVAE